MIPLSHGKQSDAGKNNTLIPYTRHRANTCAVMAPSPWRTTPHCPLWLPQRRGSACLIDGSRRRIVDRSELMNRALCIGSCAARASVAPWGYHTVVEGGLALRSSWQSGVGIPRDKRVLAAQAVLYWAQVDECAGAAACGGVLWLMHLVGWRPFISRADINWYDELLLSIAVTPRPKTCALSQGFPPCRALSHTPPAPPRH